MTPIAISNIELAMSLFSPKAIPHDRLSIGSINGATIMAPITTAVLFEISPSVAMIAEAIKRRKKVKEGIAAAARACINSDC